MDSLENKVAGNPKRILIADDEKIVLSGLERGLSKRGYQVELAQDGLEAVEKIKNSRFDVILSDLKMPKADGIEVLNQVRLLGHDSVFVMITGYGTMDNALKAMDLGAFEYVPKPFTIQEISLVVERAVKAHKKAQEYRDTVHAKIAAGDLQKLVEHLMKKNDVIAPVGKGDKHVFTRLEEAKDAVAEYTCTTLPPKKFLLPCEEELFKFDRETGKMDLPEDKTRPTVLFGVHPYDMQGILRLDQAFTEGLSESNYIERRKKYAVVGVNPKMDDYFFYQLLGPYDTKTGYDIFLTKVFGSYIIDVLTKKGADLLRGFKRLNEVTVDDVRQSEIVKERSSRSPMVLGCHPSAVPELLKMTEDDELWKELSSQCLGCGACSIVCPTCYCFDVTDRLDLNLKNGARYRKWDSCQGNEFAKVATGENFREHREQRIRHRMAHKFAYFSDKHGTLMCVGCGRCVRECLPKINPVEIISKLARKNKEALMRKVFTFLD